MPPDLILAIDQGTTSTRAAIVDATGRRGIEATVEHRQHHPAPGHVEHDAAEILARDPRLRRERARRRSTGRASPASASRTSARRSCCGTAPPAGPVAPALVWQERPHGGDLRAAVGGRPRGPRPAPHGPDAAAVLLGHQARLAARPRRRRPRPGRARRAGRRHDRLLARDLAHRPPHHRRHQRLADAAARHRAPRVGRRPARAVPDPARRPAATSSRPGAPAVSPTITVAGPLAGLPLLALVGDQQAALLGQACLRAGRGQVHLRHGRLPARERRPHAGPSRPPGLLASPAYRADDARPPTASRAPRRWPAAPSAGSPTGSASCPTRPRRAASPPPSRRAPACASSPRSRASTPRGGTPRRAARSWA